MSSSTAHHSNETRTLTITNSASTSPALNVAGYKYLVAYLPSGLSATAIAIHGALNEEATYYPAYDGTSALSTTVAASRAVRLDVEAFNSIRLVSNNASPDDITFSLQAS